MKKLLLYALSVVFFACNDDDEGNIVLPTTADFTVRIENVNQPKSFFASGSVPGVLMPGESQEFTFEAGPVTLPGATTKLSLITMFVQSNDLFFGPEETGIVLYENGSRVTGDVTDQIEFWDAGTEVNEEPGTGPNQAPRQAGPNTGTDENGNVILVSQNGDGFVYPAVAEVIQVILEELPGSDTGFKVIVTNVSGTASLPTPLAGLTWVIHTEDAPIFTSGMPDPGLGLEDIAEDGDPTNLTTSLGDDTGLITPLSPGVWAVHENGVNPLFNSGSADLGEGLEAIAEDGEPGALAAVLSGKSGVSSSDLFNTPVGAAAPGPAVPGGAYEFSFSAEEGDYLSFATMFVQSNDLFYTFSENGIALFSGSNPVSGDVTVQVLLYDAGTEVNEFPGAGLNQVIRQSGPDTGLEENGVVTDVNNTGDGFSYPAVADIIRVSITPMQ
ncbi:MAG: hypothetical protein DHS20C17_28150 [Cyclobacteriaceae bacterium]|nr:MAG: hypothetical protein DHS20C17_28150 [Cyclobacteriaceae bacterium]